MNKGGLIRGGLEQDLPDLKSRELGFTTDTKRLFVGSNSGNVELAKKQYVDTELNKKATQSDLDKTNEDIATQATSLAEKASKKKTDGIISITDFDNLVLNKGLPNEDWKDAFQTAVNSIKTNNQKLVFPAGIYQYSVSPNWAVDDAQIVSDGEVRLRYTGTDQAVIIDGVTGANSNVWNMTFGRFIIEAPSIAKDGVYINRVHHSHFDLRVRGAGETYSGINVLFTVCNTFNIEVSSNPEGWYQNAKPQIGLRLSRFGAVGSGLIPSYNTFINPIIEKTVQGGKIEDSLGNIFLGGTMEGCDDNGLWLTAEASLNKFFGLDLEVNAGMDIYCLGHENEFHGVDSTKLVSFSGDAKNNLLLGGSFKTIALEVSTTRNLIDGVKYNRELFDGTEGVITDAGIGNRLTNNTNVKQNRIENRPPEVVTISVGISPFVYRNNKGNDERILLKGGTITELFLNHNGAGDVLEIYNSFITLCPGDELVVTYTAVPTMRRYST